MAKKLSEEQLKELCELQNVNYIDNIIYHKTKKKTETHITFICEKHKKYGEQHRSIYDFKRQNKICKYCSHSALKETFVDEMSYINPDIEILSEYKNWDTRVKCRCKICNNEWNAPVSVILYGGGCEKCGYIKSDKSRSDKQRKIFMEEIKNICPTVEIIGEYTLAHKNIKCKCKIHGTVWETTPTRLKRHECSCPDCVKEKMHEKFALTNDKFIQRVKEINPDIIPIEEYRTIHDTIKFRCKIHNIEFYMRPDSVLFKKSRCPKCSRSLGEIELERILGKYNIKFYRQHSFPDCKNINVLEFDTYCYERNMVVEYQGEQHYYPVDFAGRGEEWAKEQFEVNQKRDQIKRDYCKENNIVMIEIPYWEYNNMEEYLKQYIV